MSGRSTSATGLGRLDQLPTGALMRPLDAAWNDWLATKDIAPHTKHDYTLALCRLTTEGATVNDLPRLIHAHQKDARGKRPRTFNKDRAAALSFLRSVLGAHHWLYAEVARAQVLKIPESVKLPINPLTVGQAKAVAQKLPIQHLFSFWGMLLTGMRPEEWFEERGCTWTVEGAGVKIAGTKRPASNRTVPKVGEIVKPQTKRLAFYRALSTHGVAPYDLRRSYAVLLELAEIPTYRQDYYRGHGPKDMGTLYKRQKECTPYLVEDAKAIDRLIKSPQKSPQSGGR
jgi:hypothetical protein